MHIKRIVVFEDLLQARSCGSRGEKRKSPSFLHGSVNQERLCIPPEGKMKRKLLMFLSLVLLSEERGIVQMFDSKPGSKFETLTSGLHIC